MPITVELTLSPQQAADPIAYTALAAQTAGVHYSADETSQIAFCRVVRRSVDARSRAGGIKVNMAVELWLDKEGKPDPVRFEWPDVSKRTDREVLIVGAGPAGLFAALELIEKGYRPIVVERGKDVSRRKKDIAAVNRNEPVNPDSNYAFGEGGAGTYSDGKLYTRSKKRGNWRKTLEILHWHGADENILYEAHPHIGTDRLPRVIEAIRETITQAGGTVLFDTRVRDFIVQNDTIMGVVTEKDERITARAVILATGHSARDIYELLHRNEILIEAKPFAMGVRVEHQQSLIDRIQYKTPERSEYLPAASYSLVAQVGNEGSKRGVYSFCMCPGGFIVPALTEPGQCVVNGMSPSGRNNQFANSGIVTQVLPEDFADLVQYFGPLAGLRFQQQFEQMGFAQGGGNQVAPAQRLDDFVSGKSSRQTLPTSYHPGLRESDMHAWMPKFIAKALRGGFKLFDQKMRGFITGEAQIIGIESRTSSPVRIPRNRAEEPQEYMHPQIKGLYPAGEGAGFAGGIVSAAVDGAAVAGALVRWLENQ